MKKMFLFAVAATLLLASCKKDQRGAAPLTYKMTTADRTSQISRMAGSGAESASLRTQGGTLTWNSGFANTTEIKFEVKGEEKVEYKSAAKQHLDLFASLSTIGTLTIPEGTYEKVEFNTSLAPTATEPALQLQGSYESGGVITPITLQMGAPFDFKFEKKTPTTFDGTTDYAVLNYLTLDVLASGLTDQMLSSATKTNGIVVISTTSNPDLYNTIWTSLQNMLSVEIK